MLPCLCCDGAARAVVELTVRVHIAFDAQQTLTARALVRGQCLTRREGGNEEGEEERW